MRKDKMILGADVVVSTDCQETGLNNNVLICGSSGCGKTMSVIEPRLLETYNSNPIVTVTKRRIIDKYKPVFRKRGYQVLDMNLIEPMQGKLQRCQIPCGFYHRCGSAQKGFKIRPLLGYVSCFPADS